MLSFFALPCPQISAQVPFSEQFYEYPAIPDLFFIRTYLVFNQKDGDDWAYQLGEAERQARAQQALDMLNEWYNPHRIYFVAAEADPDVNLEEYGCYKIYNSYNQVTFSQSSGLNIVIGRDDASQTPSGFEQPPLPSNLVYVEGNENGTPGSSTKVLVHKVAHCFGLVHTFHHLEGNCNETVTDCAPNSNMDCRCCGDYVCDTAPPSYGGFVDADQNCSASISPLGIAPEFFINFMAHTLPVRCYRVFTPEQVLRMRTFLKNSSLLQQIQDQPNTIPSNSNETWNTSQTSYVNIIVEPGATLTINATLSMGPGAYIIVRRGGTLIVNGTITADCGGMWGGIVAEGNPSVAQLPAFQGRVILNSGSIIEHAVCGVGLHGVHIANNLLYGGIVQAFGAVRNCITGIRFQPYLDTEIQNGIPVYLPNASLFQGARFVLDDDYRGTSETQPIFTKLNQITQLSIHTSSFMDLRTACTGSSSRAIGIEALEAGFRVLNATVFRNLDKGILASVVASKGGLGSYMVRTSSFLDCYTGIYTSLMEPLTIANNYFRVQRPEACPAEAQMLQGIIIGGGAVAMGLDISGNLFESAMEAAEDELYIGIDLRATGAVENLIRKNTFRDLNVGNRAAGNNGDEMGGVWFECNQFSQTLNTDFEVTDSGSIRSDQGHYSLTNQFYLATGNILSDGFNISNNGFPITYYFENITGQIPTAYSGDILTVQSDPNPTCSSTGGECPPPCDEITVNSWASGFYDNKSSWLLKQAVYPTIVGDSAQSALYKEIQIHRSAMDIQAGKLIRNYALDTTGIRTDSVLAWMERLQRFESDLMIARNYFFKGDLTTFDAWLPQIALRNDLSALQSEVLDEFIDVATILRPYATDDLSHLPGTALDSLVVWADHCNDAGFIAQEILRRNGHQISTDCSSSPSRPESVEVVEKNTLSKTASTILLAPNPAGNRFRISGDKLYSGVQVLVTGIDGNEWMHAEIDLPGELPCDALPQGMYFVSVIVEGKIIGHQRLVIIH